MSFNDICKDDYGYPVDITFIDTDTDEAADISAYSTAQYVVFKDPKGNKSTRAAAFKTDGSDGVVRYTLQEGDIDEAGTWKVRLRVQSETALKRSKWRAFFVTD